MRVYFVFTFYEERSSSHAHNPCGHWISSMERCSSSELKGEESTPAVNAIGRPEYEYGVRTMPPPLAELLESKGCKLFLDAMRKAQRLEGANGITILAPNDNAFYSGKCWNRELEPSLGPRVPRVFGAVCVTAPRLTSRSDL